MNSKKIILVIIVVAALAGAGVFAYLTFNGSTSIAPIVATPTPVTAANSILPYGTKLDFDSINKFNETGRKFQYPIVTPSDTGLQLNEIISQ